MEKKILITTVALSLVAVAIVIIASTNRLDSTNEDSSFVGKIQNDAALETIPAQSLAPQTNDLVQDVASELISIDTKPITVMPQDKQLTNDINASQNTDIPVTEESVIINQEAIKNNQSILADNLAIPPATEDAQVETQVNGATQNADIIEAPNAENTISNTVNLADTKPPLESLLFKSGDDNLPVSPVPNILAKEEKNDLSVNKFDEVQTRSEAEKMESAVKPTPKTDESKVEAVVSDKAQTPEITKTDTAKTEAPKTENAKKESDKAKVLVTSTKLKANGQDLTIVATKLEMNGDVVSLRLEGNQALSAKTYILNNPERVVFDLSGKWEISVPRVISNRMVKSIRLGEQAGGTRIVFDMLVPAKKSDVKKVDANTLELNIR